ncbi:MAG: glycosyltransferase family 2 protein, partial [Planctomycetota bacterium]
MGKDDAPLAHQEEPMRSSPAASPSTAAPFVSVVIPTCNRRAVVQRCIEALARQTYAAFEVIVVDDGSADDTPAYLEEVPRRHPSLSFRWFRNEPQQGANAARNRGVRESRGAIVALLDDDCVPEPTWV